MKNSDTERWPQIHQRIRTTMSESGAAGEKGFQRTRRTESAVEYVYDTDHQAEALRASTGKAP
jgi:hypothetical protein